MPERYLEDLKVGDRFRSSFHTVSEEQIIRFAREFDPQPFHLDTDAAKQTLFRGLAASGWHTAAITMRLIVTGETRLANGFIGLGVEEVRWPKPVRAGDTLQVESEILEIRPSRSKPERGIVRIRNVTTNQHGQVVQTMVATLLVNKRKP
jgi:acyl dehydratase